MMAEQKALEARGAGTESASPDAGGPSDRE
jgi:hypothetical protein